MYRGSGPLEACTGKEYTGFLNMLRLNLGCGRDIKSGYTNVDARALPGVDVRCDVFALSKFAPGTVDEIFAKDILEHCPRRQVTEAVRRWVSLLRPGGKITIVCPNLHLLATRWMRGELTTEHYVRQVYGEQDCEENTHRNGFDKGLLVDLLRGAGMRRVEVVHENHDNNNLWVCGIR